MNKIRTKTNAMSAKHHHKQIWVVLGFFSSVFRSVLNILATLLLVSSLLSLIISPERFPLLAYMGLLFPFIIVFIAFLALYNVARRKWKNAIFEALLLIMALPASLTYCPLHKPTTDIPDGVIKLLSWNVMAFDYSKHLPDKPNPVMSYLQQSDADIICLQEAYLTNDKSKMLTLEQVKDFLPNFPYVDNRNAQGDGSNLMILSKFPIEHIREIPLKSRFNGAVAYRLNINGKDVELVNVHLETSGVKANDGEEYFDLVKEGRAVELSKKVYFKLGPSFARRAAQVDRLALDISTSLRSTPYVILCGDFNDTPMSYARHRLTGNLVDLYRKTGLGLGYSFNLKGLGLRIDHMLASPAIKGYNCTVDASVNASDHKPIYCYLQLGE